ncbi:MAG: DUF397 domain-containing protein [Streptosporangiaceae bacterium]
MTSIRRERGDPGTDLSRALWRKSTYSGGNGSCVEIADLGTAAAVCDSKDPSGPKLIFAAGGWRGFVDTIKAGKHSL